MRFTKEEFDSMVEQLLDREQPCFDMLCHIAEKTLRRPVTRWCNEDPYLRGKKLENDIMQEIHLRLMKTVIGGFLLRDDVPGPYNNNPDGFEDWMFTVAKNLKRDYANFVRGWDFKTDDLDDHGDIPAPERNWEDEQEQIETLKQALDIVLEADVGVYKTLTWLAQFVFVLGMDVTKIQSNELIIQAFENKTLYEMFDMILVASRQIPWLEISSCQRSRIMAALKTKWDGEHTYGETRYCTFFMKNKGEISGKKSISDWSNRLNTMIKRKRGTKTMETDPEGDRRGGKK